MFTLALLEHVVRIAPWDFNKDLFETVADELNRKLANRVLYGVGLCISLHDIVSLEKSFILPGDGASHTKTLFQYVVFRPLVDEILIARIRSSSREGVYVSMGFFDDIFIEPASLQEPSHFDDNEQVWYWQYGAGHEAHKLFMDCGQDIRVRVVADTFADTSPTRSQPTACDLAENTLLQQQGKVPYLIQATINEPGLGPLSWWAS